MCLLVLPVASMCQLCTQTHTHTHTGSRMLSRCCSRRWRLDSGVVRRSTPPTHAAAAATTNTNVLRSAGLAANGCTKHNTQKKLSFTCVVALLLFFLLLLLFYLARESSAVSVCGWFVVGILWRFHVFYIIFAFVYVTAPTHSQLQMHDARNGKWERVWMRAGERERARVEPKTQTNSSSSRGSSKKLQT